MLYYPSSENKGADQLRGNREVDLRLCFRICKKPVFSQRGSFIVQFIFQIIKLLLMIIVAFLLCWGPKLTLRIFKKLQLPFLFSEEAYIVKVRAHHIT